VEAIRKKYLPEEESGIDILKRLDRCVRTAGKAEGLCLGLLGALVFGGGLCFFLGASAGSSWLPALFMILGALIMIPAYPLYRRIADQKKAELAPKILHLSEKIMKY